MSNKSNKFSSGDWIGEVTQLRLRKTSDSQPYGSPYCATATITIIHDTAYIEGLLNKGPRITKTDHQQIKHIIAQLGLSQVKFYRFNGKDFTPRTLRMEEPEPA